MRIAVTYENGQIFHHFGHTEQFKLYDVENGAVTAEQVVNTNGSGHGALAGFLHAAGVDAHTVEYNEARWKKAVWNMPFNGMTVALDTQTDLLLANTATRQLIYEQMLEVVRAARACGVENIDETFADKMIYNTEHMTPYSPSMKLDYDHGRPMEIDYIYTRPISEARRAGCPMPRLEMLEAELRFLQARQTP